MAPVELAGVWKKYRVYRERFRSLKEVVIHRRFGEWEDHWALRDVNIEVAGGETFGLIGANGAGKSTALKVVAGILTADRGRVAVRGRVSGLIELGAGFQPEYTGRENVFLNASLLGLKTAEVKRKFEEIVGFAELDQHIDEPLRTYSSGMQMRLGFSIAIKVDPEVLLVDEVLAVGDEAFQSKCYEWLDGFRTAGGTLVMVSHNLGAVRQMCDRVAWIGGGEVRAEGDPGSVVGAYMDAVRERRAEAMDHRAGGQDAPALELTSVRLLDTNGCEVAEVDAGSPLTLEISYRSNRRLETPVFGVALYRNDGTYVYGTNSAVDGFGVPAIDADGTIAITYDALPLLAGTYLITVAVFPEPGEHVGAIDAHPQRYQFRVAGSTMEQGLIRLQHRWRVVAPAERRGLG
ncbi:MAG: ABC transporter ATP-binding protein [Chloroflexota bacterium]